MPKHSNEEVEEIIHLVNDSIKLILNYMDIQPSKAELLAEEIINSNKNRIITLLNRPFGGTFPPEEIAEVLVNEYTGYIDKFRTEAAAAYMA